MLGIAMHEQIGLHVTAETGREGEYVIGCRTTFQSHGPALEKAQLPTFVCS